MPNNNRTRMIAGNWKMNETYSEGVKLAQDLSNELKANPVDGVDVVVCPPAIDIKGVSGVIEFDHAPFALGAQNCYWEESGAYTGETAPNMLVDAGCTYCIIGHSERRGYFGETDEDVSKKAKALIAHDIVPILCCGESLEVREAGTHVSFVVAQIKAALSGVEIADGSKLVIAYEPIWAIGTGKTATADDAQEVCGAIRGALNDIYGADKADAIRVLYGGSAKPGNVAGFLSQPDVDGALVGGASLKAPDFAAMVEKAGE
ncbi:MAG: triose-phosphate isomerase [Atopobiaceae bacterium]|jgi:triosephosphate isomerase|nr:triose-phosphate isomerase [Atopobiaceae bacterium]MCI2172972.1 triose-phosphate isomerase [Atopobiaceae bacterium]MCI2208377.1 triose-phosphate isomerase [Atopobiaceae bacterium]